MSTPRLPVFFISHGGGPWPWMKAEMGDTYAQLEAALADMPRQIGRKPAAVLMVSAHWEAPAFTVQATAQPGMIYDYGGFPPHTYQVHYRSPGAPAVAQRRQRAAQGQVFGRVQAALERQLQHGHVGLRIDGLHGREHAVVVAALGVHGRGQAGGRHQRPHALGQGG